MFLFNMDGERTLFFADLSGLKVSRGSINYYCFVYKHTFDVFSRYVCVYRYMLCHHPDWFLLQFLEVSNTTRLRLQGTSSLSGCWVGLGIHLACRLKDVSQEAPT